MDLRDVTCAACNKEWQIAVPENHLQERLQELAARADGLKFLDDHGPVEHLNWLGEWSQIRWECSALVDNKEELHMNSYRCPEIDEWLQSDHAASDAVELISGAKRAELERQLASFSEQNKVEDTTDKAVDNV